MTRPRTTFFTSTPRVRRACSPAQTLPHATRAAAYAADDPARSLP
jgi:hypothetical protein